MMIFEAICFALSGFFMKISDEASDEKNNMLMSIISGLLCVLFTVLVSTKNADATCIFLSILIGTVLAFKVDSLNHILSAILLIILLLLLGVPSFNWICLLICIIAVFVDEKGNDNYDKKEKEGVALNFLDKLFKYRYTLKITVLILSIFGLLNYLIPNLNLFSFEPITIIYFYMFDLSYEFAEVSFNRIYDIF
ncbi:MAG: hypothetical protein IJJ47_00060 [Methanosphaera sp.]|nr:hypothetical protein [Methanosphaera sp.]